MSEVVTTIFIGVFSGVVASVIIWVAIGVFKSILIPWYQQIVYRGINISGDWVSEQRYSGNICVRQSINITQRGHKITGSLISQNSIPGKGIDVTFFNLVGEMFDNYVDIEYKINDKRFIGRGVLLLKVKFGGTNLEGGLVAIDRFTSEIISIGDVIWKRESNN